MPYAFDTDTGVTEVSPGLYRAEITARWNIGAVPNGGYVLCVALAAVRREVRAPHPVTVNAHYLSPCVPGPADIEVDVLKEGRSLSTATFRVLQDGRARLAGVASYGDLRATAGPTLLSVAAPDLPSIDSSPERLPPAGVAPMAITEVVDFRPTPASATHLDARGGARARIEGWLGFRDGRPVDANALPLLCDAMPPAIFAAMETGWVPTLELTVHVRGLPSPGPLRGAATTRALIDGLCDEDCELWDAEGRLVAMSRQLARVLPAGRLPG